MSTTKGASIHPPTKVGGVLLVNETMKAKIEAKKWTRIRYEVHTKSDCGKWYKMASRETLDDARKEAENQKSPYVAGGLAVIVGSGGRPIPPPEVRVVKVTSKMEIV